MSDRIDELRKRLLNTEAAKTPTGLSRLWQTGRSAATLATSAVGRRFRTDGRDLGAADVESVIRLVERLGELKGVAMKAGQILGYVDPSLSPELRGLLSVLQTSSPAMPFVQVEQTVRNALAERADQLIRGLQPTPIAVASIGQVHRGTVPDGRGVAVKVLNAGIEAALASDFKLAKAGSAFAARVFDAAGASVQSFVEEARTTLLEECDYQLEARRQQEFENLFANDPDIVIPPVMPEWCGTGVLTTGWCPGQGLDGWLATAPSSEARNRVGAALFRFYVGALYQHGLFHADPHPGNYGLRDDGRLVIYDFGCVKRFEPATVHAFAELVAAVRTDSVEAMADALLALGAARRPTINEHLRSLLRGFFGPLLVPGRQRIQPDQGVEARQVLQDKRAIMQLALPGRLLFLFRLRFGLYAVLSRIEAEADWAELESNWADQRLARRTS